MSQLLRSRGGQKAFSLPSMLTSYSSSAFVSFQKAGGAGCGNVRDKMLPTSEEESNFMYTHTKRPKTVSIIGGKLSIFWQDGSLFCYKEDEASFVLFCFSLHFSFPF
jgi:hypothetical protein